MSYVLNGVTLPTPKLFKRKQLLISRDVGTISGKGGRDITARKESFILGWDDLNNTELTTILDIVDLNAAVSFLVNETNLTVNSTEVIVNIRDIKYDSLGGDYLCDTQIELIEVA